MRDLIRRWLGIEALETRQTKLETWIAQMSTRSGLVRNPHGPSTGSDTTCGSTDGEIRQMKPRHDGLRDTGDCPTRYPGDDEGSVYLSLEEREKIQKAVNAVHRRIIDLMRRS